MVRPYSDDPRSGGSSGEGAPLRRRNDGFQSPEGSFTDFTYPPYSDLPFTSLRRRRQQQEGNNFVKWAMRAVLASPVVVLVLYTFCALVFSNKAAQRQMVNSPGRRAARVPSRPNKRKAAATVPIVDPLAQVAMDATSSNSKVITYPQRQGVVDPNLYMLQQQQQEQQAFMRGYMAANANGGNNNNNILATPDQFMMVDQQGQLVTPQQYMFVDKNLNQDKMLPVISPIGSTASSNLNVAQPLPIQAVNSQLQNAGNTVIQENTPMQSSSSGAIDLSQLDAAPPMGHAGGSDGKNGGKSRVVRPRPIPRNEAPVQIATPSAQQSMTDANDGSSVQIQLEKAEQQKVYYYDAKAATTDGSGELQIPSMVYDANGNAVQLDSLKGGSPNAEIYLQPPQKAVLSPKIAPTWGESTLQDQTIIVSTVAVMALLVGALSARRMRSRSILSSCIENESLEDDIAYDTAYTTTDNSYNTFGGWKGDLEKFDV